MRTGLAFVVFFCLVGYSMPGSAQQCGLRYTEAFSRLPGLGARNLDLGRAATEVQNIFGLRSDTCEAGAYARFVESFKDFCREAFRKPKNARDGWLRVAMAAASQGPSKVPAEELKADVQLFRQSRSDLFAIADDAGISGTMQQVLDAFDRSGPPLAAQGTMPVQQQPPVRQQTVEPVTLPPGTTGIQQVRIPTVPMPPWGIVSLYEIRQALTNRDPATAAAKLDILLKWIDTAP